MLTVPRRLAHWEALDDSELLRVRLCDLGLKLTGTWLEEPIDELQQLLHRRGLRVRPAFWLSDEWLTPDDSLGIGIPFYLAHPRLLRLERRYLLEAEGSSLASARKLLRHEAGHVVCNAFGLHRRRSWRMVFGSPKLTYPKSYTPDPASRHHVQHLDNWYAQCHPDEDWAETFAVWLSPKAHWRRSYANWPALAKLSYVDSLMAELAGAAPRMRSRAQLSALPELRMTLEEYFRRKQQRFGLLFPRGLDRELHSIFPARRDGLSAARFVHNHRQQILRAANRCVRPEAVPDRTINSIILRCTELRLKSNTPARMTTQRCASLAALCAQHNAASGHPASSHQSFAV